MTLFDNMSDCVSQAQPVCYEHAGNYNSAALVKWNIMALFMKREEFRGNGERISK